MFKGHPKGLFALALANTGERFGYYTMLAIFVLFLQAKFGFTEAQATNINAIFLACVYFMPLVGGIMADKIGYGKMVTMGIAIMFSGYLLLAVPLDGSIAFVTMIGALALISVGTGFFKGNLQVMVGNLYDSPEYQNKRDNAFSIFYMAINIGAMFAPWAATKISNFFLAKDGFHYDGAIPALAHQYLDGTIEPVGTETLTTLAGEQMAGIVDLGDFSTRYIDSLSASYNYGFGIACVSLVVSMLIYFFCKNWFRHADMNSKQQTAAKSEGGVKPVELSREQTKSRITALTLVFVVVIFFWMSFHQNSGTMTFFARDYTDTVATGLTRTVFDIFNLALIVVGVYACFSIFQSKTVRAKTVSAVVAAGAIGGLVAKYMNMADGVDLAPQIFQQFNPFFVVVLTPFSVAIFSALARKDKEPSTPRKIGTGMVIAAVGFALLAFVSMGLASPADLKDVGGASPLRVSPNWLISTYLVLTFAELLLSPMGISFVSKVAPPKYKGAMMGMWFAATAIGNYLTGVIGRIWGTGMPLWMVWGILVILCLLSALFIFSIMKRLEKATA